MPAQSHRQCRFSNSARSAYTQDSPREVNRAAMQNLAPRASMLENFGLPLAGNCLPGSPRPPQPPPSSSRIRIKDDLRHVTPSDDCGAGIVADLKRSQEDKINEVSLRWRSPILMMERTSVRREIVQRARTWIAHDADYQGSLHFRIVKCRVNSGIRRSLAPQEPNELLA